jgi:hypothetical protein
VIDWVMSGTAGMTAMLTAAAGIEHRVDCISFEVMRRRDIALSR